jgi:YHS domain-containing protein
MDANIGDVDVGMPRELRVCNARMCTIADNPRCVRRSSGDKSERDRMPSRQTAFEMERSVIRMCWLRIMIVGREAVTMFRVIVIGVGVNVQRGHLSPSRGQRGTEQNRDGPTRDHDCESTEGAGPGQTCLPLVVQGPFESPTGDAHLSRWPRASILEGLGVLLPGGTMERDVVCGMQVDPAKAAGTSEYNGKTYYFCSKGCKVKFDAEPSKYVK